MLYDKWLAQCQLCESSIFRALSRTYLSDLAALLDLVKQLARSAVCATACYHDVITPGALYVVPGEIVCTQRVRDVWLSSNVTGHCMRAA